MALSPQDLFHGVDITGINPVNPGDLNNLVDNAAPVSDSGNEGKGLNLWTIDSALGVPRVPNAPVTTKWKRYIWIRIPFTGVTDSPRIYAWNDNVTSDTTYLKWKEILIDVTVFQAQINQALSEAQTAQSTSNTALATANTANSAASTAFALATSAETNAQSAISNATVSLDQANSALSTANIAKAAADNAVSIAGTKRDVAAVLNPGTAGQYIRTKADASAAEWFDQINQYVKVSYSPAKNTAPQAGTAADWTKRKIDTEDNDTGNLVTIATDIITFGTPGIYRVHIVCPMQAQTSCIHKAVLVDTDTNLVLLLGTIATSETTSTSSNSIISGIVTITAAIKNLAIYHYISGTGRLGANAAANIDFPKVAGVATKEVYMVAEFWRIN